MFLTICYIYSPMILFFVNCSIYTLSSSLCLVSSYYAIFSPILLMWLLTHLQPDIPTINWLTSLIIFSLCHLSFRDSTQFIDMYQPLWVWSPSLRLWLMLNLFAFFQTCALLLHLHLSLMLILIPCMNMIHNRWDHFYSALFMLLEQTHCFRTYGQWPTDYFGL